MKHREDMNVVRHDDKGVHVVCVATTMDERFADDLGKFGTRKPTGARAGVERKLDSAAKGVRGFPCARENEMLRKRVVQSKCDELRSDRTVEMRQLVTPIPANVRARFYHDLRLA